MAKDPAVLFYTSDFLSGTAFFTDEQRGQYIKLLCEQHQNGHIPEHHMIDICKTYDSPVLKKFQKDDNGNYYQHRMEEETKKRVMYSESRRSNRLSKKEKDMNKHMTKHMSEHMENENENIIIINKGVTFKKPTIIEIEDYCEERKNQVDPVKFYDFYESKGWMIGKNKMIDWKAAARTWEKTVKELSTNKPSSYSKQITAESR